MIWVYGGAFNPPTLAHQNIITHVQLMYPDDQVMVVPVGNDYQKASLIDFFHRYHMCHLAFEGVEISKMEHAQPYQGTRHILKTIEKEKQEDVGFIIGADQLESFTSWIHYEKLIQEHNCLIVTRKSSNITKHQTLLNRFKQYEIIHLEYPISSTQIRNHLTTHIDDLNPNVYAYIQMHALYKE
jgi:nicotinate-nucleotide adenylyltransferase